MDPRDRIQAQADVAHDRSRFRALGAACFEFHKGRDDLQAVGDAVIHFAQHRLKLGNRFVQALFCAIFFGQDAACIKRLVDRLAQQIEKIVAGGFDDIVGRTGLERADRDVGFVRPGHIDHGRRLRQLHQRGQYFAAVLARHVMIKRDQIERMGLRQRQPLCTAMRHGDSKTQPFEFALSQRGQADVVIDVQNARSGVGHYVLSGILMTERNRPSLRIASEKLS